MVAVIISGIVFHLLAGFSYHIDKHFNGWIFFALSLLTITAFLALCYFAVDGLVQIIIHRHSLSLMLCLPPIITFIIIFFPWSFDSESFEEKVEMRACYEGTQNQSTIKFRVDSSFEIHSTGIFFTSTWEEGRWQKSGDTIFMVFNGGKSRLLGDTMIIRGEYLYPVADLKYYDSLKNYRRHYYLGYCRGEN